MTKYPNRTNKKKDITININLDSTDEETAVRDLIKKGEDLLSTIQGIKQDRLDRAEAAVSKVKQDIEDLK